jgi:hypothetical protein
MPTRTPTSSNADRVSPSDNEGLISSSPPRESSHDEYSPERPSIAISATSQFTSPSNRSNTTGNLPADIRNEIHALYKKIYGEGSQRCLVTHSRRSLIIAHVVQRASRHEQVRYHLSIMCSQLICPQLTIYEYCLGLEFFTFHVDSRKNLLYRA